MEPHAELHQALAELAATLRADHEHGASFIARQAAQGIATILARAKTLGLTAEATRAIGLDACRAVAQARPSMAPLVTVASRIAGCDGPDAATQVQALRDVAKDILELWQNAPQAIAGCLAAHLGERERIVTLSRSATVTAALEGAAAHIAAIITLESRPGGEGIAAAQDFAQRAAWQVTLMPDAGMELALAEATAVVVGADAILTSGVFANKTGTGPLTRLAHARGIPVYVVAESLKVAPAAWIWRAEEFPATLIMPDPLPGVIIKVPAFEQVPSVGVTLISEQGVMSADAVARLAAVGDRGYHHIMGERPKK